MSKYKGIWIDALKLQYQVISLDKKVIWINEVKFENHVICLDNWVTEIMG